MSSDSIVFVSTDIDFWHPFFVNNLTISVEACKKQKDIHHTSIRACFDFDSRFESVRNSSGY